MSSGVDHHTTTLVLKLHTAIIRCLFKDPFHRGPGSVAVKQLPASSTPGFHFETVNLVISDDDGQDAYCDRF